VLQVRALSGMVIQRFLLSGRVVVTAISRPPDHLFRRSFRSSSRSATPPPPASYLSDPENRGKRQPGTNFDQLGSWQNRLDLSVNIEESIKHGRLIPAIRAESVAQLSLQGRRNENEDRLLVEPLSQHLLLIAIFDGHGGNHASEYCKAHFPEQIRALLDEKPEGGLQEVLRKTFKEINHNFTRYLQNNFHGEWSLEGGKTYL
jgi:protein phosphatase 1K